MTLDSRVLVDSPVKADPSARAHALARAAIAGAWFGVLPALLATFAVRLCIPRVYLGPSGVLRDAIEAAREHPLALGVGLFLFLSAVARYWRFSLPGARYFPEAPRDFGQLDRAQLPAYSRAEALHRRLATPRARRALDRVLGAEKLAELEARLAALDGAIAHRDDSALDAASADVRRIADPLLRRSRFVEAAGLVLALAVALAVALGGRARLFESYSVLSGSMLPTLEPEDRIAGNRLSYRSLTGAPVRVPRRGDIIVFRSATVDDGNLTDVPDFLVKRVIGLPGDRIGMHAGFPIINGWMVPHCDAGEYLYVLHGGDNGLDGRLSVEFLEGRAYLTVHTVGAAPFDGTYVVQPGEVFVLGDNRNNSIDSRAYHDHHGGGVPLLGIEARVDRFLTGRRADTTWDFSRLFRSTGSLATTAHLSGVDLAPLQAGIDHCVKNAPTMTTPPSSVESPAPVGSAP